VKTNINEVDMMEVALNYFFIYLPSVSQKIALPNFDVVKLSSYVHHDRKMPERVANTLFVTWVR
jgi:hypothetical protein